VEEKPDFESTTAVLARRAPGLAWLPNFLRQRLTPAALSSAIGALVLGLWIAITWIVSVRHMQETVASLERERDLLHNINTQLQVMNSKVDGIATEVDRQRQWRERIESEAEAPPHPRKRR
jgi:cell division protein FtsB